MPKYSVREPGTGRRLYVFEGEGGPPTEQEIAQAIAMDPNRKPVGAEDYTSRGGKAMTSMADVSDLLSSFLPAIGGTAGGMLGGIPGAALGGAAGRGYQQLAQHGTELPGALADILRNLVSQPGATIRGAVGGAGAGAVDAAEEGGLQGAAEASGQAIGKYVMQPVARGVMRGYLKPSLSAANIKEARTIVQTALDEALPVTAGGERRAGRLIGDLNADINSQLAKVKGKIDLRQVADRVRAFAKARYFKPGIADGDYQAALEVADAIDKHAALQLPNGGQVTKVAAPIANDIKQAVRPASRAYGTQGAAAETTTRKVAGSEMRQAIENTASAEGIPDIGAKNAREGRIIDTKDAIARAAGREENKGLNPTAVPNLIAGGVGLEEGYRNDPASALAWTMATRAMLSPAIATRAAILAFKLGRNGYAPAAAARLALQTVRSQGARSEAEEKPERDVNGARENR